jgi:outer membrane protein OmpA-like peptidoglycan-associated protein
MKLIHSIPCLGAAMFLLLAGSAMAQKVSPTKDAPNTRDFPGMPRYEGSTILLQSNKKFGDLALQIGGLSAPDSIDPKEVRKVEGRMTRTTYLLLNLAAGKRSALEVARNYELALKEAGFAKIWSGTDREIRNGPPRAYYNVPELDRQLLTTGVKDRQYFCMENNGLFAAVYVSARSWEHTMIAKSEANPWGQDITIPEDALLIQLDLVDTRPMEEKMIHLSAEEMSKSIGASGKVAIYGIQFDFNKADIKPESAPSLEEMAKLLKGDPALKVLVVGHTDAVGTFEFNEDLSKRRARAVAAELSSKYGIESARMTPLGASFMAPVATNATEEGRALNRRVELVAH